MKPREIQWHDSLIAHHVYASHFPQRLDWVVSEYCDASPWKIHYGRRGTTEKGELPCQMSGETLTLYNAADARLTAKVWQRMAVDLERERTVYEHDLKLAALCRDMTMLGIGVDEARRAALSEGLKRRAAGLKGEMRRLLGWPDFAPSKLNDVRRALFRKLRARWGILTGTGLPSTSDAALESLQGDESKAGRFATMLLTWRKVTKIRSTYVDSIEILAGRTHYGWKPFGTVSGRLAGRLQSCPRYSPDLVEDTVRSLYIPAPGNFFLYFDVSQAEMRLAAYLSGDVAFMKACDGDVHANNAKQVFPEIAKRGWLDGDAKKDPARGKPFRDIGKNLGFAISYGAEAEKVFITLRRKGFGVSFNAVQVILARLRAAYRTYYRWVESNLDAVKKCGYMRTPLLGRIRWLGWYPKATDVANFPIQSALADVMNERTIRLAAPELVAQVHDAAIYDVSPARGDILETQIKKIWSEPLALPGGKLVLPIDLKRGSSWADL